MMNTIKLSATVAALSLLAACSGGSTVLTPAGQTQSGSGTKYTQIERLSRPAIKEVFEPFQDHQKSNAVEPYNDPTIQADIVGTEDYVRPPNASAGTDYGKTLASVLYPDEYLVNLSGSAPASTANDPELFLSAEVDGSSAFGGRAPNDDVIDLELPVLFGGTLHALGIVKGEDGEENNCLSSQNIASEDPSKLTTSTFPYLPKPH
jgi:hypothetical protein